ncbi:MAG: GspE/PulE family protein [Puniceicoccales bacterium]|jgi:type II secretory ATPase GspE/PulE/Tfp pilus assembly ATPase PilB-like protein|nr:GspE/PulE family protein [Puniceicoccales bacterium]
MMDDSVFYSEFGKDMAHVLSVDPGLRLGEFAKFLDCNEDSALSTLAKISGLKIVKKFAVNGEVLKNLPYQLITEYKILPLSVDGNVIFLIVCWPLTDSQIKWITVATGFAVECSLGYPEAITKFIAESFGLSGVVAQSVDDEQGSENSENEDAVVIKFVNDLLKRCIGARATDIHFEPQRASLTIRYRVDGDLVIARVPDNLKKFQAAIISRLKIMARLNISEKRHPQDGKILFKVPQGTLDIRVSTLPTTYGESVSLRILANNSSPVGLEDLGLDQVRGKLMKSALKQPHGIVLVTGPTGSGKSTTLSACLRELRVPNKRLMTVEDPIEYEIQGVNQTQVNPEIGLTFASVLRSILRQDPDIIMIGEIRDRETAEIAIRASITGHLVLSTLHTNDSVGALTRLRDIGVEEFLLSSAIRLIVAQRLVRKLCPHCSRKEDLQEVVRREVQGIFESDLSSAYMAHGCDHCDGLGYYGRVGVFEILDVNDAVREAIVERKSESEIRTIAVQNGMLTLKSDVLSKIKDGTTSIDEAMRIIGH